MNIYSTQQDLAEDGLQEVLDYWFSKRNVDLHTQIPARVVQVNYKENSVKVQPLIRTAINKDQALDYPQISVPMSLLSTGKGRAKITLPVKVGCVGLLKFSERDTTNWINSDGNEVVNPEVLDNLSLGVKMYPISFEVGLFTKSSAIEWDSENLVVANGKSSITEAPDGTITVKNSNGSITLNKEGGIVCSVGNAKLTVSHDGMITANGATITQDGNIITKTGTNLDEFKAEFNIFKTTHVHAGVTSGSESTSPPTPTP